MQYVQQQAMFVLTVLTVSILGPSGWILAHLDHYKSRGWCRMKQFSSCQNKPYFVSNKLPKFTLFLMQSRLAPAGVRVAPRTSEPPRSPWITSCERMHPGSLSSSVPNACQWNAKVKESTGPHWQGSGQNNRIGKVWWIRSLILDGKEENIKYYLVG